MWYKKVKAQWILLLIMYTTFAEGQNWKMLNPPAGLFNGNIHTLAIDSTGNCFAAGSFKNNANGYFVAGWDGESWKPVGTGDHALKANAVIRCIANDKSGNLYAAGDFSNTSGYYSIAKWDGNSWLELGESAALNLNGPINSLFVSGNGNLYAAGAFTDSLNEYYLAKWDGVKWTTLTLANQGLFVSGAVHTMVVDNRDHIFIAGDFKNANGEYFVAEWDGTTWNEVGRNSALHANGKIKCIKTDSSGNLYAAGEFTNIRGHYLVARWNDTLWSEVGGFDNGIKANGSIYALAISPDGKIYAGGVGTNEYGNTNLMQWNGVAWNEVFNVGYIINGAIQVIEVDNSGSVFAAGSFKNDGNQNYVAKWNGELMMELGKQGRYFPDNNGIKKIAVDSKGIVYAVASSNPYDDDHIESWDGKTWKILGGDSAKLLVDHNAVGLVTDLSGNLYVSGNFTNDSGKYYIAKWDGYKWSELGASEDPIRIFEPITLLTHDDRGNIYAAGAFGDSSEFVYTILRWNEHGVYYYPYTDRMPCSIVADSLGNVFTGTTGRDENGKYYVVKTNENGSVILGKEDNALNAASPITSLALDKKGFLIAGSANNGGVNGYGDFATKWDGYRWSAADSSLNDVYKSGYITSMVSDKHGYVFAASSTASNSKFTVARWDGMIWSELGTPYFFNSLIESVATDMADNIYAAGLFNGDYNQRTVAGCNLMNFQIEQPQISPALSQFCTSDSIKTFLITNYPLNPFVVITVNLDGKELPVSNNHSFSIHPSEILEGIHELKIVYKYHDDTTTFLSSFFITSPSMPKVALDANFTTINDDEPVILTARNLQGGGKNPGFTFSRDKEMSLILQTESPDSILNINARQLHAGINNVYVRMRTSDNCYSVQTSIDSIEIVRNPSSGITDPDFPDSKIYALPNPFQQLLTLNGLQLTKSYTVSIRNSAGLLVYNETVTNATSLNIDIQMQAGIYWLTIFDNKKNRVLGSKTMIKSF